MRRRIVVLFAGLAVLALLVWGGIAAVQGVVATAQDAVAQNEAKSAEEPVAAAGPEETAEPSPTASEVIAEGPCDADDVKVTAATDKETYAAGEKPKLTLKVQNTSDTPCAIDVGTSQQEFVVSDGDEQLWSSADCQDINADQERARDEMAFAPDATKESVLEWGVLRSTQGCTEVEEEIKPGSYELTVHLGEETSKAAKFTLDEG